MSVERADAKSNAAVVEAPTAEVFALLELDMSSLNHSIAHKIDHSGHR